MEKKATLTELSSKELEAVTGGYRDNWGRPISRPIRNHPRNRPYGNSPN